MTSKLLCVNIINSDDICIESISFSNCGQYLAASYGNNIAIYEVRSSFLLTTLSDFNTDASFRSILWIPLKNLQNCTLSDYRLFTLGLHGIITEWDLNLFKQKDSCNSFGGAIFSGVVSSNSDLLVTCDDGCVRSFSIWDDYKANGRVPSLEFKKVHVTHTKSILSICCLEDGRFFCGTSDSLILICDIEKDNYSNVIKVSSNKNNKRVNKYNKENENNEDKEEHEDEKDKENKERENKNNEDGNVHIWCLVCMPNNVLASGDSNGNVMLWDLETLTMLQLFTQHNSDVLSLVLLNKNTLFSAGLDSKVTMYTNNNATTPHYFNEAELYLNNDLEDEETYLKRKSRVGWSVNGFKYPVKGDIRTLSASAVQEFVASAGNFGCVSICRAQKFLNHKKSKYKLMFPNIFPFNPVVSMSACKNIALVRYDYHCDLWYLPTHNDDGNAEMSFSTNFDRKNNTYKQNQKIESEVPYKLCTMKMNVNKGKIKSCCLSPKGDVVAISNEQGLRILLFNIDELKISQLKFEHPDINVTSMAFMSNDSLLLTHFRERNVVSVYNISDGSLRDLDYIYLNEHVVKVTVHHKNLDSDEMNSTDSNLFIGNSNYFNSSGSFDSSNGNSNSNNTNDSNTNNNNNKQNNNKENNNRDSDKNKNNNSSLVSDTNDSNKCDSTDFSYDGFGVFYCLDGAVYVVDFGVKSWLKLPDFEGGTRISSVAFSTGFSHLIAFSTSFKYYLYDLNKKNIVTYQGQFVHNINSKVFNPNSVICNSFWFSNLVIVHTSYNIFYFKLTEYPFNTQDQMDLNTPSSIKTNSQNIIKTSTSTQNSDNTNNKNNTNSNNKENDSRDNYNRDNNNENNSKEYKDEKLKSNDYTKESKESKNYYSLNSRNTMSEEFDFGMSTPKQTKQHNISSFEDLFLTQSTEYKRFITPKQRKQTTAIAPRRLYQVPSIEHYVYNPREIGNNKNNSSEFSNYSDVMKNIFDSRSGENMGDSNEEDENEKIKIKTKEKQENKKEKEQYKSMEKVETNEIFKTPKSSETYYSLDSSGFELDSGESFEKYDISKNREYEENENKDNKEEKENKNKETKTKEKEQDNMKSNEKLSIKYNNIIKSKFIVHVDLLFREQQLNIMAFKTSLKDEVMRQKRYGN